MKATVSSSTLSGALGLVSRAVSPRSTLPVLSNALLETTADGLRVTATNLDLTITVVVPATVLEEGRTTVPARLLGEFVSSLGDAPCSMELDPTSQVLKLTGGVHRANLHGIDAVEFPPLPARDTDTVIEVDAPTLQGAIAQTVMAASSDEASRHLTEVARAVNPNRPTVGIAFAHARNQVFFTLKDVEISSRLIEGTYPNYSQVIPGESTTTVSLSTASLLREAKTAAVLARDAANPVRLRIGDGTLTLLAQTAEVGDDEAPLTATVKGDDVQIAFNARCMLDALSALDSDEVQLSFNGSLQPGVIRPVGKDDYLCIIMPVRVA